MSISGQWEVWELCEDLVWSWVEKVPTRSVWHRDRGDLENSADCTANWGSFDGGERGWYAAGHRDRRDIEPLKSLSNLSPAPHPEHPEKPPKRPTSSLSNHSNSSASFLSPSEFNRPAFQLFLKEFLVWCEQTAYVSPNIRVRAETLGKGMGEGKLVDVKSGIKLMRDLERVCVGFPQTLSTLYEEAQAPLPIPASLLHSKSLLLQSISSLSLQHLLSLRQVSPPSPEVEVTCLAFLLLLSVLDGVHVLNLHKNGWKAFLTYLKQPGKCLQAVKRTISSIETGEISENLIFQLSEKVNRIEEMALKGVSGGFPCILLRRYLKNVIFYHEIIWKSCKIPAKGDLEVDLSSENVVKSDCLLSPTVSFGNNSHIYDYGISDFEAEKTKIERFSGKSEQEGALTARFTPNSGLEDRERSIKRSKSIPKLSRSMEESVKNSVVRLKNPPNERFFRENEEKQKEKSRKSGSIAREVGKGKSEGGKTGRKTGLSWTQLQVVRAKEKLERGMKKYVRT